MGKIIKTTKIVDKILSVLRIWLIVSVPIAIIISMLLFFAAVPIADAINKSEGAVVFYNSGPINLSVDKVLMTPDDLRTLAIIIFITIAVFIPLFYFSVILLKRITGDMKNGGPFSQNIPTLIKKLAIIVFAYAAVEPALNSIYINYSIRIFNAQQILSGAKIFKNVENVWSINYNIDIFTVLLGLLLLWLSTVFKYGAALQRESDETL